MTVESFQDLSLPIPGEYYMLLYSESFTIIGASLTSNVFDDVL